MEITHRQIGKKTKLVEKLTSMALDKSLGYPERQTAAHMLSRYGVYIDKARIRWTRDQVQRFTPAQRFYYF